ncbi:site-specific integrase [Acinetobacter baumannii]|uniref:site-specific integrase n=1 Tax=Acinetobacter baumannii TaxID=470 RepID=UPI003AF517F4
MKYAYFKNAIQDLEETFISFKGYEIKTYSKIWVLDINKTLNLNFIDLCDEEIKRDILATLMNFAKFNSSSHTCNMGEYVRRYFEYTGEKTFNVRGLLNFKNQFDKSTEYKVAMLRVFLKKLYNLGYVAVDDDVFNLIESWKLTGNTKGAAVLSLDPDEGPFSPIEFEAIITRTNENLAENKITYEQAALIRIFCATGRRPIQISALKVKDFKPSDEFIFDGKPVYLLRIPKAKLRHNSGFRMDFGTVGLRDSIAKIIDQHITLLKKNVEQLIERSLTKEELLELPLFFDMEIARELDWNNSLEFLTKEFIHLSTTNLTNRLKTAVKKLGIRSRETGKPIHITGYRFRYTLGTNAARQKAGIFVIAKLLDHSDTQNVNCYVQVIPEIAKEISQIMDESLIKYANAFQGKVIHDEKAAQEFLLDSNRITCLENENGIGSCGSDNYCNDNAPVACYVCNKFMPWAKAPHHLVLEQLAKEREELINLECSDEIIAIKDRVIIAVKQVINACAEFNSHE